MKKLKSLVLMALALLPASKALAQTNAQVLYDFGTDRKYVTLTLEMFKQDKWGSTYFFVHRDFACAEFLEGFKPEKLESAC